MPYIALSKILEHKLRDISAAADVVRRGLIYLSDQQLSACTDNSAFNDLTHRYARLMYKLRAAAEEQKD